MAPFRIYSIRVITKLLLLHRLQCITTRRARIGVISIYKTLLLLIILMIVITAFSNQKEKKLLLLPSALGISTISGVARIREVQLRLSDVVRGYCGSVDEWKAKCVCLAKAASLTSNL